MVTKPESSHANKITSGAAANNGKPEAAAAGGGRRLVTWIDVLVLLRHDEGHRRCRIHSS